MTGPDHEDDDGGERKAQTLRDFERWCAGAGGMRVAGGESLAGPAHAWEILARENLFTALMACGTIPTVSVGAAIYLCQKSSR